MGPFKYFVIMFLTFFRPNTQLFDDLQYCKSSKIAIFWLWWRNTWMLPLFLSVDEIRWNLSFIGSSFISNQCSSQISFLVFGSLLATMLRKYKNLCLHFTRQDGQDGKKQKEKSISYQNTKNQRTKIWDERNISQSKYY